MKALRTSILIGLLALAGCTAPDTATPASPDEERLEGAHPQDDTIIVTSPRAQSLVEPGFTANGLARGTWYMEASFPVELVGQNGTVIATGMAEAKDDWMTEEFVPFEATLTWGTTSAASATLILHKANPSGMPENDAEVQIPVLLAPAS